MARPTGAEDEASAGGKPEGDGQPAGRGGRGGGRGGRGGGRGGRGRGGFGGNQRGRGRGRGGVVKAKNARPPQGMRIIAGPMGPGPKGMQRRGGPTAGELFRESIIRLAEKHWSTPAATAQAFLPDLVQTIYWRELRGTGFNQRHLMLLEISQYLEKYLWKHFDPATATMEHVMSLCLMINEKFREGIPAWDEVTGVITSEGEIEVTDRSDAAKFGGFMRRACALATNPASPLNLVEHTRLVIFFINCFKSLENALVRQEVLPLVSLGVWAHVLESRRERELSAHPRLMKQWNLLKKKMDKMTPEEKKQRQQQALFLPKLLDRYFAVLDRTVGDGQDKKDKQMQQYCERMLEFFIDLQAQLPTRRYANLLLDSRHVVVRSARSSLAFRAGPRGLFNQLLEMLRFYMGFEISNTTGTALTDSEMLDMHYSAIQQAQRIAFLHFPELKEFALSNVAAVDTEDALRQHLGQLGPVRLQEYAAHMCLVAGPDVQPISDGELLLDILVNALQRRPSQIEALNQMPLYPQETLLFDENSVPDEYYAEGCLALPKLNLQFLTLHDYLLRNLNLFRLESTYEIKADVIDSVKRMPAKLDAEGKTQFEGWSRMALPIADFTIVEVAKPNLGEFKPSQVRADIQINLVSCRPSVRAEWDQLRKHDVLFLIAVSPRDSQGPFKYDPKLPFPPQVGLQFVRGAEVEGFLDEEGKVIEEGFEKPVLTGNKRTVRVWLDTNQYAADMLSVRNGDPDPHECFNIVMRRKAKENNFKAVLTTIRSLMNTACLVPDWLHDVFLGYGAPNSAHYSQVDSSVAHTFNMNDTFLDIKHVRESFPDDEVYCTVPDDDPSCVPPFSITLPAKRDPEKLKEKNGAVMEEENRIVVTPFKTPNMGPYPHDQPKKNTIRFTPVQTEAIKSAMHHGLTMVVGPPGTGKTDVAVQIISNWYHNNPEERTLLVTHSNQALNQLFEKIMGLDIDERHLLRLGFGEKELATDKVFTKYGRVNYVLDRRIKLLDEVQRLADSLGVKGDIGYTCETAGHFYLYHVLAKWEAYLNKVKIGGSHHGDVSAVAKEFPFTDYFATAPQPVFKGQSFEDDIEIAEGCFRHLKKMFTELEEFRAFEIMRTGPDRVNYLLVKEAKIIAMTCTHAALKREDLVKLGFNYDNVLMEEAGQILEVETFIPLMCQNPKDGRSRLKRVVMIGDHHQLPPVVKNMAFQKFSNMEQSLFTRFIRLGVPSVQLNKQGRARASIAKLYNWRYKNLGDLPHVQQRPAFQMGNAGFVYDYQLVDVPDFNGQGESEPNPYFYQNLGEAEYVVATFMYMRMLGYPAEKISIITTYNGQKHLIRDVLNARCGWDPRYGLPSKVTTVDRFQGQQNDYILLSLVRTRAVGHLRDVRRLIVAMSRARLGLYVFGRRSLFEGCLELAPTFRQLCARPTQLALVPTETYPCTRPLGFLVPPLAQVAVWDTVQMHSLVDTMARTLQQQEMAREQRVAMLSARVQEMQKAGEVRAAAEAEVEKRRKEERERRLREEEEELERLAREQAPEEMEDVGGEEGMGEEGEGEGEGEEGEGEGDEGEGEGDGEGDEEGEGEGEVKGEGEGGKETEAKPMEE